MVVSFVVTYIIGFAIQKTMGFRIDEEDEVAGIDNAVHAETGYDFTAMGGGGGSRSTIGVATGAPKSTEGSEA